MNLVFEKLGQALAAGIKWDIGIAGAYLRLSACQWPCTVLLYKQGRVIGQMNNMLAGDYVAGVDFDGVGILNGATAQTIEIQISGGGAGSSRVLGEVSVIDGGRARTLADTAKAASVYCAQLAGNYSHVQLWNPLGSGKNLVIEQIGVMTDTPAIGMTVTIYGAQLTTLYAVGLSKKSGGGASVASGYSQTGAAQIGGASFFQFLNGNLFSPKQPIILTPGFGLVVRGQGVNQSVQGSFEYYEESI